MTEEKLPDPKFALMKNVKARTKNGEIIGRIVGYEDGRNLGRFHQASKGWVYYIKPEGAEIMDDWVRVPEADVIREVT